MVREEGPHNADRQVAVLIDYENVGLNAIRWLLDQMADVGRVIVKRAYSDWSSVTPRNRAQLQELGIEPVHLFRTASSGKNASDMRLAVDAIDLLYQSPVDTFVLVSSDTDFIPLITKLRGAGKIVIGAGREATTSQALVASCDQYFSLETSPHPGKRQPPATPPPEESLLTRAMQVAAMDDQGRVPGSRLRQVIQRLDPSFDFKALGHSTFSRFLEASTDVKVTRSRGQGDILVELASHAAAPPPATSQAQIAATRQGSETSHVPAAPSATSEPLEWWAAIDEAWSQRAARPGQSIPGPTAAAAAAATLEVPRLSASRFKTLQRLLESCEPLREKWHREGNRIVRQ